MRASAWRGRPYRYIRADKEWGDRSRLQNPLLEECSVAPEPVYFAGEPGVIGGYVACAEDIDPRIRLTEHPTRWEMFELSRIGCACMRACMGRLRGPR